MEGALAIEAAGRGQEIFTTGIDGGKQAFEYIMSKPMALTMAQTMYMMAAQNVAYAHQFLEGKKVPRLVLSPVYMITQEQLKGKELRDDYDFPGVVEKLGWERKL
jgi:ABC-type sugar transport system substrate-binding protein